MINLGEHAPNPAEDVKAQIEAARYRAGCTQRAAIRGKSFPTDDRPNSIARGDRSNSSFPAGAGVQSDLGATARGADSSTAEPGRCAMAGNDAFKAALIYQQLFALVGPHLPGDQ